MKKTPILTFVVIALLATGYGQIEASDQLVTRDISLPSSGVTAADKPDAGQHLLALADEQVEGESQSADKNGASEAKTENGESSDASAEKTESNGKASTGAAIIRKARDSLLSFTSINAKITNIIMMGGRQFSATGDYQQGADLRLRLSYTIKLGSGPKAKTSSLLQVCDGQILWTQRKFSRNAADKPVVTRQDVRRILSEAQKAGNVPGNLLIVELGLGGLPALLASLQRSMDFGEVKTEGVYTVVEGAWKKELLQQLMSAAIDSKSRLPDHIPDLVRIYFHPVGKDRIFPSRIQYRRKQSDGTASVAMVTIDFENVEIDRPIPNELFSYVAPDDVVERDMTDQYIKALQARSGQPQTGAKPSNSGSSQSGAANPNASNPGAASPVSPNGQ